MNAQCLKTINRVELMPNIPSSSQMRDWKGKPEIFSPFLFSFQCANICRKNGREKNYTFAQ